mmetsp:Transcript_2757/g.5325  ORF Transcript_2757/g.5325 Transcript_2757/m.5325 type:complete len:513 (-) Transcript_2757:1179-2717(-)|eukprot:CAMPEP_0184560292 /NCGR_PEP_ID=MMETSP0199_2-20130426/46862_1 /TAXON_ID=1112570 /ORGANISM="Thraustochytrium sp., Strain LLF1b" /LENGTH=512 /DNA_ID=CAMNT_0026957593 /DNA_START=132 /DNA_END=1670 /DNA_ORIENTATION=+
MVAWISTVSQSLGSLARAPSVLWVVFLLKLLESYAYFTVSQVLTLYLTSEFGFSDQSAGLFYGAYGALVSIYGMALGSVVDRLGAQASLQLGFAFSLLARGAMAITASEYVLYASLLGFLPLAGALGIPVMVVAVRRCTDEKNRATAMGIFYCMMNVGGVLSGPMIDYFTISSTVDDTPVTGRGLTANRRIMASCASVSAAGLIVSLFFLGGNALSRANTKSGSQSDRSSMMELLRDATFLRFFSFSLLMVQLRQIFRHLDATLPKYLVRIHGPTVNKGLVYAVNPACVVLLVPVISALTAEKDAFTMILIGGYISATSAFYMTISSTLTAAILFVLQLSVGEAIWSPRFLDYMVSVAPEGKEAAFMALANAPLFLSKLPAGLFSGYLLSNFCPPDPLCTGDESTNCEQWLKVGAATCEADYCMDCPSRGQCDATCGLCNGCMDHLSRCAPRPERHEQYMWFLVLVTTLISPILVHMLQNRIREPKEKIKYTALVETNSIPEVLIKSDEEKE